MDEFNLEILIPDKPTRGKNYLDYFIATKSSIANHQQTFPKTDEAIRNSDHKCIHSRFKLKHPIAVKQLEIFSKVNSQLILSYLFHKSHIIEYIPQALKKRENKIRIKKEVVFNKSYLDVFIRMANLFKGNLKDYAKDIKEAKKKNWYDLWNEYGPKLCSNESKEF